MKKKDKMSTRQFKSNIKAGWESMICVEMPQPVHNSRSTLWFNCAGVIIFLGLSLMMALFKKPSHFSPLLNDIGPQDLFNFISDLIS